MSEAIKERPEIKLQKDQIDKIYNTILEVTKAFNQQYVHIDTLWEQLHDNRMNTKSKDKVIQAQEKNWNNLLDQFYSTSHNYCRAQNLDYKLPMIVLKKYCDIIKENLG